MHIQNIAGAVFYIMEAGCVALELTNWIHADVAPGVFFECA
jgi:hypothetical protein